MRILSPSEYPSDFYYHRTSSLTYRKYLESCGPLAFDIDHPKFAWKKSLLGGWCHVVKYERTDREPDIEILKEGGVKHAMVTWITYTPQENTPA